MKRAMFLTMLREAGKWVGPESGRPEEAATLTGLVPVGVGMGIKRTHHELESQTAEQRQKSMTGTKLGCGIFGRGKTLGRRPRRP